MRLANPSLSGIHCGTSFDSRPGCVSLFGCRPRNIVMSSTPFNPHGTVTVTVSRTSLTRDQMQCALPNVIFVYLNSLPLPQTDRGHDRPSNVKVWSVWGVMNVPFRASVRPMVRLGPQQLFDPGLVRLPLRRFLVGLTSHK